MKKRILTVVMALAFVVGLSGMALADSNYAQQEQYGGGGDSATIEQYGHNVAYQWQNYYQGLSGGDNIAEIFQEGTGNIASQVQEGIENEAYITQIGNDNYANIYQDGIGNRALQRQNAFGAPGDKNTAYIEQHGTNSGNSPWGFDVVGAAQKQFGDDNFASIYQDGWENYAKSIQTGDGNDVFQSQTGEYNYGIATQTGDGNSISQDQDGNYNRSIATQTGDNNSISQNQTGNWHYSIVTQTGNGNAATVTQGNF